MAFLKFNEKIVSWQNHYLLDFIVDFSKIEIGKLRPKPLRESILKTQSTFGSIWYEIILWTNKIWKTLAASRRGRLKSKCLNFQAEELMVRE